MFFLNKRFLSVLVIVTLLFSVTGCFRTKEPVERRATTMVELTYYKLFDDSDAIEPIIQGYQTLHPEVRINYRKFTNPEEYYDLILNELAEGEGPDIFSVPNTWFTKNHKKVEPLPVEGMDPMTFSQTFVSVTYDDLVRQHPETGEAMVYGLPMTVDTLALYYNKDHFEDKIPERGRPAETWEGIKEDVFKLTKKDNSFERFEVAGIAMGLSDNVSRAVDILYLLMIQHGTNFYNSDYNKAAFSDTAAISSGGLIDNPGADALDLYTSFAISTNKNYSWNSYLAQSDSDTKEVSSFARGKVSMIIGYSYLYDEIVNEISQQSAKGLNTIDQTSIGISMIPQVTDPSVDTEKRDAYANYFVETVARTSDKQTYAWDFLIYATSKDALTTYNDKTHKPTSRRDMIEEQKDDPIYGVFADQIGIAESLYIYDAEKYNEIFEKAIDSVLATKSPGDALRTAQNEISGLLPVEGLFPTVTVVETDE